MFCIVQYPHIPIFSTLVLSRLNMEKCSVRSTQFPNLSSTVNPFSLFFPAAPVSSSNSQEQISNSRSTIHNQKSSIQNPQRFLFVPHSFFSNNEYSTSAKNLFREPVVPPSFRGTTTLILSPNPSPLFS